MAWQQRMEAMKATRVDRTIVGGLVLGVVLGLALGLLIGWVWWPVEWQGSETAVAPAAAEFSTGSPFDAATNRALFLGATADAYVYATAQGIRDAAAVATQRLAALGGDLPAAFNDAIAFYNGQPAGAPQVGNLTTLATAVGITPTGTGSAPDTTADTAAGAAADTATDTAADTSTAGAAPAEGAGAVQTGATTAAPANPLGWLVSLLLAALLIGGGILLLTRVNRSKGMEPAAVGPAGPGDGGDGFDDELPPAGPVVPAFDRSALSPMRSPVTPAASVRSTVERPVAVSGHDPRGFEAEEDEVYGAPAGRTVTAAPIDRDDDLLDDDDWRDEELDLEDGEDEVELPPGEAPAAGASAAEPPTRTNLPGTSVGARPAPTLQPPTPSRYDQFTTIDRTQITYYQGQVDFDQGKPIGDPADDKSYLGEYSVGIPPKNGLLDHDVLKPIAMEVVLFDKSDGRTTLTTTRVLLSEYAAGKLYGEYERANPSLVPITAQRNTSFQLEGNQLLLDVLVQDVRYTREGFFQNVTLELTVKRKA